MDEKLSQLLVKALISLQGLGHTCLGCTAAICRAVQTSLVIGYSAQLYWPPFWTFVF